MTCLPSIDLESPVSSAMNRCPVGARLNRTNGNGNERESAICIERLDVEARVVSNIDRLSVSRDALRVGELAIAGAEAPHGHEVAILVELLYP